MQPRIEDTHWVRKLWDRCLIVAGMAWLIYLSIILIFYQDLLSPPDIALPFFLAFATLTAPVAILLIVLGFNLRKWGL